MNKQKNINKGVALYRNAKNIIPGGTQLLSKRPEMFLPDQWPAYYSRAKGYKVYDLDGNEYSDVCYMGIGACVLGYANDEIDNSSIEAIRNGNMCTLNAPEEVFLAEKLLSLHKWADMVRYGKGGGEAMAIAVRIARTYTNKEKVLICGYHGWHDWYLATNLVSKDALNQHHLKGLEPNGVSKSLTGTTIPFRYNNIDEFKRITNIHHGEIAAIVMEPIRNDYPENDFLLHIRNYCNENDIVLIFDEITAGFRLTCGGSHLDSRIGINPDIAVFGKAIANGYPITAIIGKSRVMKSAQDSFISSTFWTERIGFVAALKTIEFFEANKVEDHLNYIGSEINKIWLKAAQSNNIDIKINGILPLTHFDFLNDSNNIIKTFFIQSMLEQGFLASTAFYASFAHDDKLLDEYRRAIDISFEQIKIHIQKGDIEKQIKGPLAHKGFMRLN
ncbi:MAG: aminotransferase class III-fold pyridoxal phosphate-dependent enzyme [Acholeplasma sp.]|nr:aminotransferase class III-fold pyridoxal phosphate-dependent enzyme [Acholeplasma sp.]